MTKKNNFIINPEKASKREPMKRSRWDQIIDTARIRMLERRREYAAKKKRGLLLNLEALEDVDEGEGS